MHMVVTRAVEVVEQIDSVALTGMTFLWFVGGIWPSSPEPKAGLAVIEYLAGKLTEGELPTGTTWLQRLDLLNCIHYRPPGLQSLMKWEQIFPNSRPGYVSEGVLPEDEEAIRSKLDSVVPGLSALLVPHPFLPGRFRVNASKSGELLKSLDTLLTAMGSIHSASAQIQYQVQAQTLQISPVALQQLQQIAFSASRGTLGNKTALQSILLEANVDKISQEAVANMVKYVDTELPNLRRVRSWWDNLTGAIEITPLGITIAYSRVRLPERRIISGCFGHAARLRSSMVAGS